MVHRLLELEFQSYVSKQRMAYNPCLHPRSYDVIRPESASSPVISDKTYEMNLPRSNQEDQEKEHKY